MSALQLHCKTSKVAHLSVQRLVLYKFKLNGTQHFPRENLDAAGAAFNWMNFTSAKVIKLFEQMQCYDQILKSVYQYFTFMSIPHYFRQAPLRQSQMSIYKRWPMTSATPRTASSRSVWCGIPNWGDWWGDSWIIQLWTSPLLHKTWWVPLTVSSSLNKMKNWYPFLS